MSNIDSAILYNSVGNSENIMLTSSEDKYI